MTRSIRINPEKAIQKALENLKTHKFNTVLMSVCVYEVFISTLYHKYKRCLNCVTAHLFCQLLTFIEEKIITE